MSNEEPLSISIEHTPINQDQQQHDEEDGGDEGQLTTDAVTISTTINNITTNHPVQVNVNVNVNAPPKPITILTLNDPDQMTELKNRLGGVFAWKKEDDQRLSNIMTQPRFKITHKYIWDDVAALFHDSGDGNAGNADDGDARNLKT